MTTAFNTRIVQPSGLAVQADGNLVAAGVVETGGQSDLALARYAAQ